jgi:alkylation response protein AidB-like acyl-CoA dehydrogenase
VDFEYSDEQRLLGDSVGRFIAERYDFESRAAAMREPDGWSRSAWREMAEMGLLALPFAEEDGGFGGGGVETMVVMDALGRGLALEPYLSTVILAGGVLRQAGSEAQKAEVIPGIIAGESLMALAHHEPDMPRHGGSIRIAAERSDGGWMISGKKVAVLHGATADNFAVSAATSGGTSLFLVPADAAGVSVRGRRGYDGIPVAEIIFDQVSVADDALIGGLGAGDAILAQVFEEAISALAAEAVGIMADTIDLTRDYLKTRVQFGVPIGSFQALQHRAVDMLIELELARSMAILAALSLNLPAEERRRNIAAAKVQIGRSGRFIGQQAVQLHGAIGLTAEYKVGHAFKRLTAIDALLGDAEHHLDQLAEAGGLIVAS